MTHSQKRQLAASSALNLRPVYWASALALGLMFSATGNAANVNLQGLKSSFSYTPFAGESLERIIAKTMPNSELTPDLMVEAFKTLNPQQFSKDAQSVAKTNLAIKVPNQNQLANLVESQLSDQKSEKTPAKSAQVEGRPQAKGMLAGTKTATPKVNSKTESWVHFPSKMLALSKKVENWVRFPNMAPVETADSQNWVRYASGHVNGKLLGEQANSPSAEWVRYPVASAD